jgi:putative ABC transport system permease protein
VRLFNRFILRHLARERVLTLVTICGIALGVAVVVAVRLANEASVGGFAAALEATSGAASLEIVGPAGGLDEHRLAEIGWLAKHGAISPVVEGDVVARPAPGRAEAMRVLGVDILRERPFRQYQLTAAGPAERGRPDQLLRLLVDPDALITTEVFAERYGLKVGDSIELDIGDRRQRFTIRGLLRNEGPATVLGGNFILMDIAAAQWAFDRLGRLDRVEVRLPEGRDVAAAENAIASRLPAGLSVQRPARRGEQVETMLRAFHFNLTALAHVALLVGLFLVYNTVAVSVIARREEIGILRALGTTRRRVLALFLGEAVLLSIAGAVLGAAAGWALARVAVRLTATTVNTLYIAAAATVPALDWREIGLAVAASTALSLAAAAGPALEASRLTPVAALRARRFEEDESISIRTLAAGLGLLIAAAVLCTLDPVGGLPVFGFAAAVAGVFGMALLVPAALRGLRRVGRAPLGRLFGVEGRLAHSNLSAAIPRLSVSVAALSVALAMMVAIAIMIGSFRETVVYWVSQTLQADLYMSTARRSSLDGHSTISPALEQIVRSTPGVEAVDPFRSVNLVYDGRLTVLGAGDFSVLRTRRRLLYKEPSDPAAAAQRAAGPDAVLVSEAFAIKAGKHAGDSLRLDTPSGPRTFRIAAVYYDYTTDRGVVVMDTATFVRFYGESRPNSLAIYLQPGASPEAVRDAMLEALGDEHRVFIHTNATLRREVLRIFDSTFAITYALEAIAIAVAIMGVAGTLFTLILERRRDLTILRLVGAGRRQVRRMVLVEAGVIGLVSQVLGMVAGVGLALILIYVINVQSFGWTIQFFLPVAFLLQMTIVMTVATSLAGLYPARLASAVQPVERPEE